MNISKHESKNSNFSNWHLILMMSVAVVVWAFAFPFIKLGLEELSFINLTIMRFFIVCIVLLTIILLQPKRFSKLEKKDIIPIFLLGFFGVMVYHLGLNYGEQFISPGAASLIIATSPILIVIFATIFLKEKLTFKKFLGIALALAGVILISLWGEKNSSIEANYILAALAVFIASVMTSLYTVAGKKLLKNYSGLSLTTYAMLLGSIGLIPFLLPDFSIFGEVSRMSSTAWFAVIFLGVFSTVIGYVIWYVVLKFKTASEIGVYLYAVPVLSIIISYILFKDEITFVFILGGFLVIIGLIIVNMNKDKQKID